MYTKCCLWLFHTSASIHYNAMALMVHVHEFPDIGCDKEPCLVARDLERHILWPGTLKDISCGQGPWETYLVARDLEGYILLPGTLKDISCGQGPWETCLVATDLEGYILLPGIMSRDAYEIALVQYYRMCQMAKRRQSLIYSICFQQH